MEGHSEINQQYYDKMQSVISAARLNTEEVETISRVLKKACEMNLVDNPSELYEIFMEACYHIDSRPRYFWNYLLN